jgi:hypothetical protein
MENLSNGEMQVTGLAFLVLHGIIPEEGSAHASISG